MWTLEGFRVGAVSHALSAIIFMVVAREWTYINDGWKWTVTSTYLHLSPSCLLAHRAFTELFHPLNWLLWSAPPPTISNQPLAFLSLLYIFKGFWSTCSPFSSWCPVHSNIAIIIVIFPKNMPNHFLIYKTSLPQSGASCLLFPVALCYWHGLAIGFRGSFIGTYHRIHWISLLYHLLCRIHSVTLTLPVF